MVGGVMHRTAKALLFVTGALFFLSGCSLLEFFLGPEEEKYPQEIMAEGIKDLEAGRYQSAVEAFQNIKDRYPYSKYAIIAELKMADALYFQKEYDLAYEAYDEFEKLHPKNEDIPYVIYQKGMCYFEQVKSIDREQENTRNAQQEFERLIRRFPRDDYANRARRNIRKCLIFLAEYELYVGHYYFKRGYYHAALGRYLYIMENYPDMGQYHEAMEYISKCKEKLTEQRAEEDKKEERTATAAESS
jgi:outer membrane protein assembly factor BamD